MVFLYSFTHSSRESSVIHREEADSISSQGTYKIIGKERHGQSNYALDRKSCMPPSHFSEVSDFVATTWTVTHQRLSSWDSQAKILEWVIHFLLQDRKSYFCIHRYGPISCSNI